VAAAEDDLRPAIPGLDFQQDGAHLVMRLVFLGWHHVRAWQQRLGASQADRHALRCHALHRAGDQVALPLDILLIERLALGFADLLQDDLLGSLGRNAAELAGRIFERHHDRVPEGGVGVDFPGRLKGDLGARVLDRLHDLFFHQDDDPAVRHVDLGVHILAADTDIAPVRGDQRGAQRLQDGFTRQRPLIDDLVYCQDKLVFHPAPYSGLPLAVRPSTLLYCLTVFVCNRI